MSLFGPMWLAILTGIFAVLTLLFWLSVRWWLKEFPVTPLNYTYETNYARAYPQRSTNYNQAFVGVHASSAVAYLPGKTWDVGS